MTVSCLTMAKKKNPTDDKYLLIKNQSRLDQLASTLDWDGKMNNKVIQGAFLRINHRLMHTTNQTVGDT